MVPDEETMRQLFFSDHFRFANLVFIGKFLIWIFSFFWFAGRLNGAEVCWNLAIAWVLSAGIYLIIDFIIHRTYIEINKPEYENYKQEIISDSTKKASDLLKQKELLKKRERARKSEIFSKYSPQMGHRKPTMKMKDNAWNRSMGSCKKCFTEEKDRLEFLWTIFPSVELVLICDKCAKAEGIEKADINRKNAPTRRIPVLVQDAVWNRDGGMCVSCGSKENLEFDHIIPFSKGGSNTKRNIQLLCQSCNRTKSDNIG